MAQTTAGSILVVDDNAIDREIVSLHLSQAGFSVEVADNGEDALKVIAKKSFDLIILDDVMPKKTGLTVLKTLRKTHFPEDLPVIMVTSKASSEDIVKALELGANDYVTKPVDFPVATARIRTHLAIKRMRAALQHSEERLTNALRESEERHALALLGSRDGIWDWDLRANQLFFSTRWKSMLGFDEHEIGNTPEEWLGRVHPGDVAKLHKDIQHHVEGITLHFKNDHRILHKNGSYRWVVTRGATLRVKGGAAYRMAGSMTDVTEHKVLDPLTGLPNRVLLNNHLERAAQQSKRRSDYIFALLFVSVNRFGMINEGFGQSGGDSFLVEVARRLRLSVRASDTLAALGGPDFAILIENIKEPADCVRFVERAQQQVGKPFYLDGHELNPTTSIGIVVSASCPGNPNDMLSSAETAMRQARYANEPGYAIFDAEMQSQVLKRIKLENDLHRAIQAKDFILLYQPVVSLSSGKIVAFEALLRWRHPRLGLVPPAQFIPLAEETGAIVPLGSWVMHEACRQLREWQRRDMVDADVEMHVNISPKQFGQANLTERIKTILQDTGLNAGNFKLEITESVIMDDPKTAAATITALKEMGVKICIDDFGTGFSSLSYLYRFDASCLKIDKSFVAKLETDPRSFELVRSIIALAHNFGMTVVSEGIETAVQMMKLKELGSELGQGYLFSKPMGADEVSPLLRVKAYWWQNPSTKLKITPLRGRSDHDHLPEEIGIHPW